MRNPQLARLYYGVFALHAVLMALFIAVPLDLRSAGLPVDHHWQIYLPVMAGSFVLMLPAILRAREAARLKAVVVGAIAVLLLAEIALPWASGSVAGIAAFLLVFFTAFNILEAQLPALVTRMAPAHARGVAIGAFSSLQFFGAFFGAAVGGFVYGRWETAAVVIFCALILVIWLWAAAGTEIPAAGGQRAD